MPHYASPAPIRFGALAVLLASMTLAGCATTAPGPGDDAPAFDARAAIAGERSDAVQDDTAPTPVEAPRELEDDLLDFREPPRTAARFDVQASDVPIQRFFADLGRTQDVNVLVDPAIEGRISLNMRSATIDQVMTAVRDLYGYDYQRTDYGYRVLPNQIQTRIYQLNYLNVSRSGRSDTTVSGGQISNQENGGGSPTSSVATEYAADFWQGMETTVMSLLDDESGRQVVVNAQSGMLVVRATPREHDVVKRFLDDAELNLQRQVVIEAKVVEVTLNNEFRSGINWNTFAQDASQSGDTGGLLEGNPLSGIGDIGGVFSLSIGSGDFSSMLQLLSNQGDVQVLSSPRVSTVNNQKAVIKVGTDEFFVTEVSSRDNDDDNDTNGTTPEFVLAPFFSGIALDVTPQISAENNVILHVRPSVTDVQERTKVISVGGATYNLPLALSSIRETDSIIRASSGQIVVIGGLLSQQQDSSETGLPWLSQMPGLKYLFGQNRESRSKSELVILLKPIVYDERTTMDDLDRVLNRMQ